MSTKMPRHIAKSIWQLVYNAADEHCYLAKSRSENSAFFRQLVSNPEIGGKLREFMDEAVVRTYIKDGILNRYSKEKNEEVRPKDYSNIIHQELNISAILMEVDNSIHLYKSVANKTFIVVTHGSYLKWETALRKALLYIATKPFGKHLKYETKILLSLFARYKKIPPSDKKCVQDALARCDASAWMYGEG